VALRNWTDEEEKFVMDNYKELGKEPIAIKLGRTPRAIETRYYQIQKEKKKYGFRKPKKNKREVLCCPICGKPSNTVTSCINNNVKTVYYCTSCLIEFQGATLIPPLLDKEVKDK